MTSLRRHQIVTTDDVTGDVAMTESYHDDMSNHDDMSRHDLESIEDATRAHFRANAPSKTNLNKYQHSEPE